MAAYTTRRRRVIAGARRTISTIERTQMTKAGHRARCEIDNHADTCCLGSNFLPLSFTGDLCDVSPYTDEYKPMTDIPICTGATAFRHPETGETFILIVHEALWFGDKLDHSLLNPNQIRSNGFPLSDNPFDTTRELGLELIDGLVPFNLAGTIVYFESFVSSPRHSHMRT